MVRAKICGITNAADRDAAIAAGADAFGVIVGVPVDTPREIDVERAAELVAGAPPLVTSVLVTMPSSVQNAVTLHRRVGADAVQVHGSLPPQYVGGLARRIDARVIAGVDADDDAVAEYAARADAVLVDSTDEAGAGGTGRTHDWDRTAALAEELDVPLVLAGGLSPENVAQAIEAVGPFAVDTASGVEREGGRKDHDAVRQFVSRAHAAGGVA